MREPEFIPRWYPLLRRRRQMVVAEAWVLAVVIAGLAGWAMLGRHQTNAAAVRLAAVQAQLAQTGVDLQRLNDIETVKKELEHQDQIVRHIGVHVPASRMLAAIDDLMPPAMALSELDLETVIVPETLTESQQAAGTKPRMFRKLSARVAGLAPTYVELGTFMTSLVANPYIGDVALVRAADLAQNGHLMRTFEVKFVINLDIDPYDSPTEQTSAQPVAETGQ
jgi:hypothetical protein